MLLPYVLLRLGDFFCIVREAIYQDSERIMSHVKLVNDSRRRGIEEDKRR